MAYQLKFQPPAGVSIQQHQNALLVIHYEVHMIAPLRAALGRLSNDLLEQALADAKNKREAEAKRQQLPQDRISILDQEIQALESQRSTTAEPASTAPVSNTVDLVPA